MSNLGGLLFAAVVLRPSAVEGETSYDGGTGEEAQNGYSRRTVAFGWPGRAPCPGLSKGPEIPQGAGHQAGQECHGGGSVATEEQVDQPGKEDESDYAARREDDQEKVVTLVDDSQDLMVDTQQQEEERTADARQQHS